MMNTTQPEMEKKTVTASPALFSLKATWDQSHGKLCEIFAHLAKFTDILPMEISYNTIEIRTMDHSRVGMMTLTLHCADFPEYNMERNNPEHSTKGIPIRINAQDFVSILKNFSKVSDKVELEITAQIVIVRCNGAEMKIKVLPKEDEEDTPKPKIEWNFSAETKTQTLRETITMLDKQLKASYCEVQADQDTWRILAETDGVEFIRTVEGYTVTTQPKKVQKAIYSIEYLKDIFPGNQSLTKLLGRCLFSFSGEMPCLIEFPLSDDSKLSYFLAPRVEEEDTNEEEMDKALEQRIAETKPEEEEEEEDDDEFDMPSPQDNYKAGVEAEKKESEKPAPAAAAPPSEKIEIVTEANYIPPSEIQNPEFEEEKDSEEDGPESEEPIFKPAFTEEKPKAEIPNEVITITYIPKAIDPVPFTSASKAEAIAPRVTRSAGFAAMEEAERAYERVHL